jgi:adenylate kinase family enzyme
VPRRICVVGTTGSGKSHLAEQLSARLGLPHVELDGIYHQADWVPTPRDEFRAQLLQALASYEQVSGGWVVDGNYRSSVGDILAGRADTWVWLDYPRRLVMVRVLGRTLDRMLHRRVLWNGNREQWRNLFSRDPEVNILLWAWTTHRKNHETFLAAAADSTTPWVRLRSPRETDRWLAALTSPAD